MNYPHPASISAASQIPEALPPGARDFDFLFGRWHIRNERLRERLVGCREWLAFDAIGECRPVLGGIGNVDSFKTDSFKTDSFETASFETGSFETGSFESDTLDTGSLDTDSFDNDRNRGLRGMTLRLFDRLTQRWSIHWASDRDGVLQPPMVGRFENGVGLFFGADLHRGTPVLSRFRWTPGATEARWEQAFSTDKGETWETNWLMHFSRVGAGARA